MAHYRWLKALLLLILPLACSAPARSADGSTGLYLPFLARPPLVSVAFASTINRGTGELLDPGTNFPVGLDLLWVSARLQGYAGRTLRLDLTFPDGETLAGNERQVTDNDFRYTIAYCITTAGTCEFGREPLPAGPYSARVFVDGQQVCQAMATIH
ncbi:MAG: hypothetical protein ACUVS4_07345 [Chloroflexaceae bacterium]